MHIVNNNNKIFFSYVGVIIFSVSRIDFVVISTYINYKKTKNLCFFLNVIYTKIFCSRLFVAFK